MKRGWCPSLLRPMQSGDGWLVRVRPRAAVITAEVARAVSAASARYGNGRIEITNRANLQIRGLQPETILPFVEAMEAAGAGDESQDLPMVVLSPLAGSDPGVVPETVTIARAVALLGAPGRVDARDEPAHDGPFPPKFGILIDGGGALPLTGLSLDITLRAAQGRWFLNDAEVPPDEAASRALALAQQLAKAPRQVRPRTAPAPALGFRPYGGGSHGAVLLAPPFGQVTAAQLARLADLAGRYGDGGLRPTPWKSLAIAGVPRAEAARLRQDAAGFGLIADPSDPRLGIVTCAGAPACLRATVDTVAAALALVASRRADDPLLHLSGCAKGCAHPGPAAITLVGEAGLWDLIRDGRPGDRPDAHGLTLAESLGLMQRLPA